MLTIMVPAAGNGSRFREAGYEKPKPLVNVLGKPMLRRVMDNLQPSRAHRFVIVSRLDPISVWPLLGCDDIAYHLSKPTEGAVDTILQAKRYITDEPLLIANTDQLIDFNVNDFLDSANDVDGALVTFKSNKEHHSYVATVGNAVQGIAEKQVISNRAVTGVYYFQSGTDFVEHAEQVLEANDRYNSEFYVSSAIARMIKAGHLFTAYDAPSFMLGTPEELQLFEVAVRLGRNVL